MPDRPLRPRARAAALLSVPLLLLTTAAYGGSDAAAGAASGITRNGSDNHGYRGVYLDQPYTVPAVSLTDTADRPFDLAQESRSKRTLVFFGYSHCPDICSVVMSTIASAVVRLPKSEQDALQVVFVTTDPARDDVATLRRYLARFDPRFIGVTGPLSRIEALGKPLAVEIEQGRKLPSGGYEVGHSTQVLSVHDGRADLLWTGATSPGDMAADLTRQLGGRS